MPKKNLGRGAQAAGATGERVYRAQLRPRQLAAMERLAAEWDCDLAELVNTAVRVYLQNLGRWPAAETPPPGADGLTAPPTGDPTHVPVPQPRRAGGA